MYLPRRAPSWPSSSAYISSVSPLYLPCVSHVSPQASTKLAEQLGRFHIEISSDSLVEIAAIPQARQRILALTLTLTPTPTPTPTLTLTGAPAYTAQRVAA